MNSSPALCSVSALLLLPLLAARPQAQTTVLTADLRAHGNFGVYATQGTQKAFKTLAAGNQVPQSMSLSAFISSAGGVDTIVGWRKWPGDIVTVDISEQGAVSVAAGHPPFRGGSTASASSSLIVPGPHALLLKIGGRPGARGLIEVWGSGVIDVGVGVKYTVDVGNDGSVEFGHKPPGFETKFIPVTLSKAGTLVVKLESFVSVVQATAGSLRYKTGMSLRFTLAPTTAVRIYGESCGPRLSGRITKGTTSNVFKLDVTGSASLARGLLVIGTEEIRWPLPGTKCPLLTKPVVSLLYVTDASGRATWSFKIPIILVADVKLQAADLAGGVIKPTNGVHVLGIR